MSGKLIVIYGINNIGKSTQAKLLVKKLKQQGLKADYIKYPIYNLQPSGQILNNYLRQGNTYRLTPREAQIFYAFNRFQYEPTLRKKLEQGINIIAEDYVGTGLAWGIGAGVDQKFLNIINFNLLKEDIAFLLDGQRFLRAKEKNHKHESDDKLNRKVRQAHLKLGKKLGWKKINANQEINAISDEIWRHVLLFL